MNYVEKLLRGRKSAAELELSIAKEEGINNHSGVVIRRENEISEIDEALLILYPVVNNESDSEVAFCDSPIHDFDRCPLIKQRNDCKSCRYYN